MEMRELPGMLVATGIASREQAEKLLEMIQSEEAIESKSYFLDPDVKPLPPQRYPV